MERNREELNNILEKMDNETNADEALKWARAYGEVKKADNEQFKIETETLKIDADRVIRQEQQQMERDIQDQKSKREFDAKMIVLGGAIIFETIDILAKESGVITEAARFFGKVFKF